MYLGGSFGRKLCRSWDWFGSASLLFADATSLRKIIALQFLVGGLERGRIYFFAQAGYGKLKNFISRNDSRDKSINLE